MTEFTPYFPTNLNKPIMILGEAPGAEEEKAGLPFVGMSGKLLRTNLLEIGINADDCYITNVFWERPPNNQVGHFFTTFELGSKKYIPMKYSYVKLEYENHISRLQQELELINPKVVIAVGGTPMWALTGLTGITQHKGKLLPINGPVKWDGCKVLIAYHPAYVLRNRSIIPEWKVDLALALT